MEIFISAENKFTYFIEASNTQPISEKTEIKPHTGFKPAIFLLYKS
jgi:hypothetical protein